MRIYSDVLTVGMVCDALSDARAEIGLSVHMDITGFSERARKRKHRVDIALEGTGPHHTRWKNTGKYGAASHNHFESHERAATWMDWGWLIAVLFRHDPHAVIGQYDGVEDFHRQTSGRTLAHRMKMDRSVRNFARQYAAWWDGESSPFTLVDRVCPPNKLINLRDTPRVEAWLADGAALPPVAAPCVHCFRHIERQPDGTWIDPDAPTDPEEDDHIWRETCEGHDTFTAEHEPDRSWT